MSHPLKIAIAADGRHAYQVAAAAQVNPSYVSAILAGRVQPSEAVKERLAAVLDSTVDALFSEPAEASA